MQPAQGAHAKECDHDKACLFCLTEHTSHLPLQQLSFLCTSPALLTDVHDMGDTVRATY